MTIDEAIKHCLEVAEENDLAAGTYEILAKNNRNAYERLTAETNSSRCAECAADHRQLAEWLMELKELKALVAGYNPADIQTLEMLLAMMRNQNNNDTNLCELCDKEVELKEAKRLLKSAVEDINWINEHTQDDDGSCIMRTNSGCSGCPLDINGDLFCKWKHNDEALKLIEKGENDEG